MTQYARLYGGSLYDLAAEENLTDAIGEQMKEKIGRASCRERV